MKMRECEMQECGMKMPECESARMPEGGKAGICEGMD